MYSMTRVRSALIAVRIRRFCRFLKRERNSAYQKMIKKFTLLSGEGISLFAVSHYSSDSKFPVASFSFHTPVLTEH